MYGQTESYKKKQIEINGIYKNKSRSKQHLNPATSADSRNSTTSSKTTTSTASTRRLLRLRLHTHCEGAPELDSSDGFPLLAPIEAADEDPLDEELESSLLFPLPLPLPLPISLSADVGATCTAASSSAVLTLPAEYLGIDGMSDKWRMRSMMSWGEGCRVEGWEGSEGDK